MGFRTIRVFRTPNFSVSVESIFVFVLWKSIAEKWPKLDREQRFAWESNLNKIIFKDNLKSLPKQQTAKEGTFVPPLCPYWGEKSAAKNWMEYFKGRGVGMWKGHNTAASRHPQIFLPLQALCDLLLDKWYLFSVQGSMLFYWSATNCPPPDLLNCSSNFITKAANRLLFAQFISLL